MKRNIYFSLRPWHTAPNVLGISRRDLSFCVLVRRLVAVRAWMASGWGLVATRTNQVIRGLEHSASLFGPLEREEGLKVELTTNGQGWNPSCQCKEASIKTLTIEVQRASRLPNTWRCAVPREGMDAPHQCPPGVAYRALLPGCSWIVSFWNTPVI